VSEQGALERAKAGNGPAFEELLAPVLDPAFRLAMTMLNDRAAAEDAVQEAALKAWRKLDQIRAGSPMRPWFLAIVANECRSARRAQWWNVMRFPDLRAESAPPPDTWAERADLQTALGNLAPHHLLALTLYYHLDLPIDEVARVFGCSQGGARQRVHRALAALRPGLVLEVNG